MAFLALGCVSFRAPLPPPHDKRHAHPFNPLNNTSIEFGLCKELGYADRQTSPGVAAGHPTHYHLATAAVCVFCSGGRTLPLNAYQRHPHRHSPLRSHLHSLLHSHLHSTLRSFTSPFTPPFALSVHPSFYTPFTPSFNPPSTPPSTSPLTPAFTIPLQCTCTSRFMGNYTL